MSPRTRLIALAIFIGIIVILLLNLMDVPFRPGYGSAVLVIAIAVVFYVLLTRIADKLRPGGRFIS